MKKLNLLLVEDDMVDCKLITKSLKNFHDEINIEIANSSETGYQFIKKSNFDIILLDNKLPDIDGLDFLKQIRKEGITIPVVIITSHGDETIASEAIKSGANDYIPKSLLTPEGLSQCIRSVTRTYQIELIRKKTEAQLMETQERLKMVVSNAPVIMFSLNKQGIFTLVEGMGLETLGLKPNQFEEKYFKDCPFLNSLPKIDDETCKNIYAGKTFTFQLDLEKHIFETSLFPLWLEGEIIGISGVAMDITEKVHAEKELVKAKELAEKLSLTDELTGLYNRRGLSLYSQKYIDLAKRNGYPLTLWYIDFDDFKKINDTYGHSIGDLALKALATALTKTFRESDIIVRIGGDEFVVLLAPEKSIENTKSIKERLESNLENFCEKISEVPFLKLSISIGRASIIVNDQDSALELLLDMADKELYEEKLKKKGVHCD